MPEPLSLVGIRHEQRRVAALLDTTKQFGVVVPSRQDGIPFEDLYKSDYYLQMQSGLGQMKITGTQKQTATSLPGGIGSFVKTHGNQASKDWTLDKADKTSTAVLSLDSTEEGWKQIRDVRQRRESYKKRKQLKNEKGTWSGSGKRLHDSADGAVGWSPDQATREQWTRKKIRADRELSHELSSRRSDPKSTPSVNSSEIRSGKGSNWSARSVDYRLPKRVAQPGRLAAPGGTTEHDGNRGSIYGKPLLRYNHGDKGADLNLSSQRSPNTRTTQGGSEGQGKTSNHLSYLGALRGSDRDSPFYPFPPSVSPASTCSDYEFDFSGRNYNITPAAADERGNPGVRTGAGEGYVKSEALGFNQGMNHKRSWHDGLYNQASDASASHRGDGGVYPASIPTASNHLPLPSTRQRLHGEQQRRRESELAVNAYRDAYTRALAVARSRRLPDDFTGLGTRTTPAYTFSYFTHVPTCKCQKCLDRIFLQDSGMKTKRSKKRKKTQGLKLILGDVELNDYYR
ncbi:uncharacterized protein [Asterias amurensis]